MFVNERFVLDYNFGHRKASFGFNQFGEITYYRTYSRRKEDGSQEHWPDTVRRVINGVLSIRKDWYAKNHIAWDEQYWQEFGRAMADSMFEMEWLPPGRGLWAMGSDVVYDRGAAALYNCAFTCIKEDWVNDICWLKDMLMYGCGVGFRPYRTGLQLWDPLMSHTFVIPDTREGWVEGLRQLLVAFRDGSSLPVFDYSLIRPEGARIVSFGGTASGPEPLRRMYEKIEELCYLYLQGGYDEVMFKTDLANLVGVCVVTGNVRRSAEIALCNMDDPIFLDLKNYDLYPERGAWGWMSNNSVVLERDSDFEDFDILARRNEQHHDVGYLNMRNVRKGRIGKNDPVREDMAVGLNPCGEIPLEDKEVCNIAETLPTRCANEKVWLNACRYATFYCQTVSLLPTHQSETNKVVCRNRRIGVSLVDVSGWIHEEGVATVTRSLRRGYNHIRRCAKQYADEAGVVEPIRVTTVKPGGTVPKIAGRTASWSFPTFEYTLRRINVQNGTPTYHALVAANIPHEPSAYTEGTTVFEYPIHQGPAVPATDVSTWQQAMLLCMLQREWADNAVSNTLYFTPGEKDLDKILSMIAPLTKSVSLLPHTPKGAFKQMPEEGITKQEYEERLAAIGVIDFSNFRESDGQDEKYCEGPHCAIDITA